MAFSEDTIKLILDVVGEKGVDDLARSTEALKRKLEDLSRQFHAGTVGAEEFTRDAAKLNAVIATQSGLMEDLKTRGGSAFTEFTSKYKTEILNIGRVTQDFAQGGLGGILNNIEGLLVKFPALAGIGTILGVALWAAWPTIKKWFDDFTGAAGGAAAKVADLTKANVDLKEELAKLSAAGDGRVKQLAAENDQLERQIKLAKQQADNDRKKAEEETERQVKAVAMLGAPSLEEKILAPGQKARAEEIRKIVGGDPEARLLERLTQQAIRSDMLRRAPTGGWHPDVLNEQARERTRAMLGRFYAGDPEALRFVAGTLHPMMGAEGTLREQLERLTPQAQMQQRLRDVGQTLRGFGRRAMEQSDAEARKRAAQRAKEADDAWGREDKERVQHAEDEERKLEREGTQALADFKTETDKLVKAAKKESEEIELEGRARKMEVRFRRAGIDIDREQAGRVAEQERRKGRTVETGDLMDLLQAREAGMDLEEFRAMRAQMQQDAREQQAAMREMLQAQNMGMSVEDFRAWRAMAQERNRLQGQINQEFLGQLADDGLNIAEMRGVLGQLRTKGSTRRNGGRPIQ